MRQVLSYSIEPFLADPATRPKLYVFVMLAHLHVVLLIFDNTAKSINGSINGL